MNNTSVISETVPQDTGETREPRWGGVMAFLMAWLLPATTARRTGHVSLLQAWLVHLLAAALIAVLIVALVAWSEAGGTLSEPDTILVALGRVIIDIGGEFQRHPIGLPSAVTGIALAIEVAFLGVALLVMPWGACDEPVRTSYRNALRQVWLHTTHVIPCVLLVGTVAVMIFRLEAEWRAANPGVSRFLWGVGAPWYIEYNVPIIVQTACLMATWLLWGLLRGVGVIRSVPRIERPPTCEACGYNLTTIPMESRCPECGEAITTSLGSGTRPGTVWQRRREVGRWAAWRQCYVAALLRPRQFGRRLRVVSSGTDHRRFLAVHLPVIFYLGLLGIVAAVVIEQGTGALTKTPEIAMIAASMFGLACVVGAVMLSLFAALVVGLIESFRYRRNVLPGAIQIACYLGGYLTTWALFGAVSALEMVVLPETDWYFALEYLTGIDRYALAMWTWFLPNAAWGVWYFVLVARGTAGTRYANR